MAVQGKIVGFIRPPPEIRAIVDKTAQFVAKHGEEFESKIMAKEAGNAKFAFLSSDSPYHAYYRHRIQEEREGPKPQPVPEPAAESSQTAATATAPAPAAAAPAPAPSAVEVKRTLAIPNPLAKALKTFDPSKPGPKDQYSVVHPTYVSGVEVDTIKLTAQFAATGGQTFLSQLAAREARNPSFEFLKPTNALFGYFTSLVDAYTKVLKPQPEAIQVLALSSLDRDSILERCVHRLEHKRREEERRRSEAEAEDSMRSAAAAIDWHDFVVVETIEFDEDETSDFAPEADASGSATARAQAPAEAEVEEAEMDMDIEDGGEKLDIRTDYVPQVSSSASSAAASGGGPQHFLDPRTGRLVPIEQASEVLRIELMDPKWREQNARAAAKLATTGYAADEDVASNLRRLAQRREDIFGSTGSTGGGGGGGGGQRIGASQPPPAKRARVGE
jgi:splicing factor 3A subunit 1